MALAFNPDLHGFVTELHERAAAQAPALRLVRPRPYDGEHDATIEAFAPAIGVDDLAVGPITVRQDPQFRRRRIGALVVAAVGLYCCWMLAGFVGSGELMQRLVPSAAAASAEQVDVEVLSDAPAPPQSYTVKSGDTLWSIATELQATRVVAETDDLRALVNQLADSNQGAALRPGQVLSLDGLSG